MGTSVNGQQQLLYQVTAELCISLKTEITNIFNQCIESQMWEQFHFFTWRAPKAQRGKGMRKTGEEEKADSMPCIT